MQFFGTSILFSFPKALRALLFYCLCTVSQIFQRRTWLCKGYVGVGHSSSSKHVHTNYFFFPPAPSQENAKLGNSSVYP